jgi:signal transduction histidine kinase
MPEHSRTIPASPDPKNSGPPRARTGSALRWYFVPLIVFLMGVLAMAQVLALDLSVRHQRVNSTVIDAYMAIQIKAAVFHLRVEELLAGGRGVDLEQAISCMGEAIRLADLARDLGEEWQGTGASAPPGSPGTGSEPDQIKPMLTEFKRVGLERVQLMRRTGAHPVEHKQFDTLFNDLLAKSSRLEERFKADRVKTRQSSARLFLGIYLVWGAVVAAATAGLRRMELRRKRAEESLLETYDLLRCQAEELKRHRENLAEMVAMRTAELTRANQRLQVEIAERQQAEETLRKSEQLIRHLSVQLLNAQEVERKRISMGLHDELGQALSVIKLRVRSIGRKLGEDQKGQREDCDILLDYLDTVIEDVRRLSLQLSPTIMEDLGLTAALRWMIGTLQRDLGIEVALDIPELDHFFPERHQQITIYRVLQEATTNISKHAQAQKVSITARQQGDRVNFSVHDDGRGFDTVAIATRSASEKGLGLVTMSERVTMLGGSFELRSSPGQGTEVAFILPVAGGGVQ